jgi:phosphoglycerate-specific signal transduction histidine kinase
MNAKNTDQLAKLFNDADNASKNASLVANIKDSIVRDAFATCIKAKATDQAVRNLIVELAKHDVEKLEKLIAVLPLSNASALRQSLEKGFDLPASGAKAVADIGF